MGQCSRSLFYLLFLVKKSRIVEEKFAVSGKDGLSIVTEIRNNSRVVFGHYSMNADW